MMTDADTIAYVDSFASIGAAARDAGVPYSTLRCRYRAALGRVTASAEAELPADDAAEHEGEPSGDRIRATERGDRVDLIASFKQRVPADEIMRRAGYDPRLWAVKEVRANQWETSGKRRQGQDDAGRWKADKLWKTSNYQVSITLQRRDPKHVQDGIGLLLDAWKSLPKLSRPPRRSRARDPHLLEVSLVDAHFGKLCWGEETGDDYDVKIARDVYLAAVDDLIARAGAYNVEQIVFPVGQDFFNVDNWQGTTEHGTLVDSTDDRFAKVFTVGCDAIRRALLRCRDVAPVRVLWSPGNHDRSTSWYLCKVLSEFFAGAGAHDVEFDLSPRQRKFDLYGNQLLGWTHGCDEKPNDLPLIMAREAKELWSQAKFYSWHMGHFHTRRETRYIAADTFNGVEVVILPSLSGTDSWHSRKGWSKPQRAADAYLWSRDKGKAATFHHNL